MFKITGTLVNGQRFRPIFTENEVHAYGINLWRGSVWKHDGDKYRLLKRVWN